METSSASYELMEFRSALAPGKSTTFTPVDNEEGRLVEEVMHDLRFSSRIRMLQAAKFREPVGRQLVCSVLIEHWFKLLKTGVLAPFTKHTAALHLDCPYDDIKISMKHNTHYVLVLSTTTDQKEVEMDPQRAYDILYQSVMNDCSILCTLS